VSEALTILIVDDHPVLRSGVRMMIDQAEGMECVGEASRGEDAVRSLERLQPEIVIMDLEMPGQGGLAAIAAAVARRPGIRILVLSMHDEITDVQAAFAAGAAGYVVKSAADDELLQAIRAVAAGEQYLHPALGAKLARPVESGPVDELSPREREVLKLLSLGYTNQEIADRLVVSVRTVESHRAHVMTKLRATNRAVMVRHALRAGLLENWDEG
jgi:two-component system response regulator NreC